MSRGVKGFLFVLVFGLATLVLGCVDNDAANNDSSTLLCNAYSTLETGCDGFRSKQHAFEYCTNRLSTGTCLQEFTRLAECSNRVNKCVDCETVRDAFESCLALHPDDTVPGTFSSTTLCNSYSAATSCAANTAQQRYNGCIANLDNTEKCVESFYRLATCTYFYDVGCTNPGTPDSYMSWGKCYDNLMAYRACSGWNF